MEDEAPMRNTSGVDKFSDTLAFTPYTPRRTAVDDVVQLFNPVSVEYHQVLLRVLFCGESYTVTRVRYCDCVAFTGVYMLSCVTAMVVF